MERYEGGVLSNHLIVEGGAASSLLVDAIWVQSCAQRMDYGMGRECRGPDARKMFFAIAYAQTKRLTAMATAEYEATDDEYKEHAAAYGYSDDLPNCKVVSRTAVVRSSVGGHIEGHSLDRDTEKRYMNY